MEIHQLEYVVAVDQYQHFSLAAEQINVSQPTLSHQIKKLEAELGVQLFIRTTRSIQVTEAGKEFITYAKRILSDIEQAKQAMMEHANLKFGHVRIGAIPNMTYLGITALIVQFKANYPGINLSLYEDNSESLLKKMNNHEIDVAFINTPNTPPDVAEYYPLIQDHFVLFVSQNHRLSDKKIVSLTELSQEQFIIFKMGTNLQNRFVKLCKEAGFKPDIILESGHIETMKGFVEEGIGILFASKRAALSMVSNKTVIIQLTPTMERVTGLAIGENSNLLSTKAFRDYILMNKHKIMKE